MTFTESMLHGVRKALASAPRLEYPPQVELYRQGDGVKSVYFIVSGVVKLSCIDSTGKEIIVGLRRSNILLGGAALILGEPNPTSGATLMRCQLMRISVSEFWTLLRREPEFSRYLHEVHAYEVHHHLRDLVDLASRPAEHRLAKLLFDLIAETPSLYSADKRTLRIPLKQYEIAELLTVTPEHTSRILRRLEEKGLVQRKGGSLLVNDSDKLISFLGGPTSPAAGLDSSSTRCA